MSALAARLGVPHVARDVFLDNDTSSAAILRQLADCGLSPDEPPTDLKPSGAPNALPSG